MPGRVREGFALIRLPAKHLHVCDRVCAFHLPNARPRFVCSLSRHRGCLFSQDEVLQAAAVFQTRGRKGSGLFCAALGRWQRAQLCPSRPALLPRALAPSAAHRELKPSPLPASGETRAFLAVWRTKRDYKRIQVQLGQPDFASVYAVWLEVVLLIMKQQRAKGFIAPVLQLIIVSVSLFCR